MKSHEIFRRMSPALAVQIFTFLQAEQKSVYKLAIQGLANQRNLRGVFIERKPVAERHVWMREALGRGVSDVLAGHILQGWLLGANKRMLCEFLDALGIKHAEDGTVDELPPEPPKEKVLSAVEQLLGKYPAEKVAVYLCAFQDMDSTLSWPVLNEIISSDNRLVLGGEQVGAAVE